MGGPWEDYAHASPPADDGPWTDFAPAQPAPAPAQETQAAPTPISDISLAPDVAALHTAPPADNALAGMRPGGDIPVLGPLMQKAGTAVAAGLGAITPDAALGPDYRGKGFWQLHDQLAAEEAARRAAFAKAHPVADAVSKLAGAAALPVAPELEAGEGAGALARAGTDLANRAIRVGGNTVVIAADTAARGGSADDVANAAKQAASIGGALEVLGAGALAGTKLGQSLADVAGGAGEGVSSLAEQKAFKAAVGNQAKPYNEAAARGVINERGRELLDQGVVGLGDSAQQIADKAAVAKAATGSEMEAFFGDLDREAAARGAPGLVSGKAVADQLRAYGKEIGGTGNKPLVARLTEAANDLEQRGNMSFAEAQVEKNSWTWEPGSSVSKAAARRVKGIIGDEMENAVGRLAESNLSAAAGGVPAPAPAPATQFGPAVQTGTGRRVALPQPAADQAVLMEAEAVPEQALTPEQQRYQELKSRYGTMAAATKDAQVNANRYAKNNAMSLGDKAAAAAGAVLNPHSTAARVATGAAAGIANKLLRKRGESFAAVSLDKIGQTLQATPEVFGKFAPLLLKAAQGGPQSLAVTHYMLCTSDPDYQDLVSQQGANP